MTIRLLSFVITKAKRKKACEYVASGNVILFYFTILGDVRNSVIVSG